MQVIQPIARLALAFCLSLAAGWHFDVAADGSHKHGGTRHGRPELGTSAAFDAEGRLWIAAREAAEHDAFVVLQVSEDLGKTWSAPKRVQEQPEPVSADGESRPRLAFGARGEIYITYTKPLPKPYTGEIRFVRSTDGGETFTRPITVHANRELITHRFDSMAVDKTGRIYVAWIDKRDMESAVARGKKYAGAAVYYAVSENSGETFRGDFKIADHSCECCRIGLAANPAGEVTALWRHVFDGDMRDHALAELRPDGKTAGVQRATFENWRLQACPHHGPSLAYTDDGRRHQVWFSVKDGEGSVLYSANQPGGTRAVPQRIGSGLAAHADVATHENRVAIAWKQFDGKSTVLFARLSEDGGRTWQEKEVARTRGNSDQPRLASGKPGIVLVWRTQDEGLQTALLK